MSHIFDALQRQESERTGLDPSQLSVATELLKVAERGIVTDAPKAPRVAEPDIAAIAGLELPDETLQLENFGTLAISIPLQNRLVCLTQKDSLAAEKFRFLGVRLRQLQQKRPLKRVLVTSSIPEEGKSMVAANLACTLTHKRQHKVLLVDGDLRRPTIHKQFGIGNVPGLSDYLQQPTSAIKNVYRLEEAGIWILPAGTGAEHPLEMMQTGTLSGLMKELSAKFDWIVIDSPPVLPLADTSVWQRLADGVLLVTREGRTEKQQLKRGLEALDGSKLLGALVNGTSSFEHTDYYYRYSSKTTLPPKQATAIVPPVEP